MCAYLKDVFVYRVSLKKPGSIACRLLCSECTVCVRACILRSNCSNNLFERVCVCVSMCMCVCVCTLLPGRNITQGFRKLFGILDEEK